MWVPDTFIVNERRSTKHDLTVDNIFTSVMSDGEVLRSMRITVTASCKMNLKWFPFDRHTCSLVFESYGYSANEIAYVWDKNDNGEPKIGVSAGSGGSINQEVIAVKGGYASISLSSGTRNSEKIIYEIIVPLMLR